MLIFAIGEINVMRGSIGSVHWTLPSFEQTQDTLPLEKAGWPTPKLSKFKNSEPSGIKHLDFR